MFYPDDQNILIKGNNVLEFKPTVIWNPALNLKSCTIGVPNEFGLKYKPRSTFYELKLVAIDDNKMNENKLN